MARRTQRMLLAYAVQYDDGSLEFTDVLECDSFDLSFDPDLRRACGAAYYGFNQTYTVTATGREIHTWPANWRRPADAAPAQIPAAPHGDD